MRGRTRLSACAAIALCCWTPHANAWFFIYVPASIVGKVTDAITGSEGEHCVSATAKLGDTIRLPSGGVGTIKSLSGTSRRCKDRSLPIRALVVPVVGASFVSKAGIDVPDGFEAMPLTDDQRAVGNLLHAQNTRQKTGFFLAARRRNASIDSVAEDLANWMRKKLDDAHVRNEERISINGFDAVRFEVVGKEKAWLHPEVTYAVSVVEGDEEIVVVNAWSRTADFEKYKASLQDLPARITGLGTGTHSSASAAVAASSPASVPIAAAASSPAIAPAGIANAPAGLHAAEHAVPVALLPASAPVDPAPVAADRITSKLRELNTLLKDGLITQRDYDAKKAELLKSL